MAENSLSQAVSFINDNSTMEVGLTTEGQPAVRSDIVAYHFKRNHRDVLRDIRKLRAKCPESFYRRNFAPVEYADSKGEKRPAYLLTRDGFSLLVMGFTGAEAVRWKLRYIEAFNSLEAAALGAWLHGAAGDLCADEIGEYGMLPSDLIQAIPRLLK